MIFNGVSLGRVTVDRRRSVTILIDQNCSIEKTRNNFHTREEEYDSQIKPRAAPHGVRRLGWPGQPAPWIGPTLRAQ
jgi:hypothetical protein